MQLRGLDAERLEIGLGLERAADDDLLLNVTVSVAGYSAADQSWVAGTDWRHFVDQLKELERHRQGEATLVGALPDDLTIRFGSTGPAGHVEVTGHLAWTRPNGYRQCLDFGFPFDAGLFPTVLSEFILLAPEAT